MHPILIKICGVTIYSYGMALAASFLLCLWLGMRNAALSGVSTSSFIDLYIYIIIAGVVGSRLLNVLLDLSYYLQNPLEIFQIQKGGLAFHGGLLCALVTGYIYLKKHKLPIGRVTDIIILYLPLGEAIGRIGCFLNGCCYGIPTNLPLGVQFPSLSFASMHYGVGHFIHPVQLYSSLISVFIFIVMRLLYKNYEGRLLFVYLILSGISRFYLEFFRAETQDIILGLDIFQFISMGLAIIGFILIFAKQQKATNFNRC